MQIKQKRGLSVGSQIMDAQAEHANQRTAKIYHNFNENVKASPFQPRS